jgi:ectoine hydroxylase-related dioxygenase (phytanoyl-CoA dioxygenase family)
MNLVESVASDTRSTFQQEGHAIFREVLRKNEVARVRSALDETLKRRCGAIHEGMPRQQRPEYVWENHVEEAVWFELCRNPRILDVVEKVLGPDLLLLMSGLIVKPPHHGYPVDWHQDNTYWASVSGTDIVTVWLAIDDVNVENGCMHVLPRSHQDYVEIPTVKTDENSVLKKKIEITAEMKAGALPIELKAGDLSIHDSFILHSSPANVSPRRRAGYTIRYANAKTVKVDLDRHHVPAFLVRGSDYGVAHPRLIDARPGTPYRIPVTQCSLTAKV